MEELVTVWNGEKDRYLCIQPLESPVLRVRKTIIQTPEPEITRNRYHNRREDRVRVLKALAGRETCPTGELRAVCGLSPKVLQWILQTELRNGTISRPSYGVVALVVREVT